MEICFAIGSNINDYWYYIDETKQNLWFLHLMLLFDLKIKEKEFVSWIIKDFF